MNKETNTTDKKSSKQNPKQNDQKTNGLELALVDAWQRQAGWLWLLWPLSGLYGAISKIRQIMYKKGVLSSYRAPIPVMVVGNITIGGSGKTPLIIALVKHLQAEGIKVGVISRGYGGNETNMPCMVTADSLPEEVGDEPCLIKYATNAPVSVCPNRQLAIECLLDNTGDVQLIIADDGLQHYKLQRDIEWIVVDSDRGFGNKQLLPTGFLREPISRLKSATVVWHESKAMTQSALESFSSSQVSAHKSDKESAHVKNDSIHSPFNVSQSNKLIMTLMPTELKPLTTVAKSSSLSSLCSNNNAKIVTDNMTVYAISGIGYPQRFFNTLESIGFDVIGLPMPDHHNFELSDLINLTEHPIVITEKDAVKIAPLVFNHSELDTLSIWVLSVEAKLSKNVYSILQDQLNKLDIHY